MRCHLRWRRPDWRPSIWATSCTFTRPAELLRFMARLIEAEPVTLVLIVEAVR